LSERKKTDADKAQFRFGIGEWYGRSFTALEPEEQQRLAKIQLARGRKETLPCPFQSTRTTEVLCGKPGGVCSLRLYAKSGSTGEVQAATGETGRLRATCPQRFEEGQTIYRWVGESVLHCPKCLILGEIGFLESPPSEVGEGPQSDVGRIDKVLVVPGSKPLSWCALEVQAVYFQGGAMRNDFDVIRNHRGETLPFPKVLRRPDYRSSGPKRLMPQLQIKVPSLRRWGKKMAVVIDRSFFSAMGRMRTVPHISNCDVAWFVVRFEERQGAFHLSPDTVQYTTLEDSVEGLTAGVPVSLDTFEQRIVEKIKRLPGPF
jgi:hypothetical protein